jgi:hypothetical protein
MSSVNISDQGSDPVSDHRFQGVANREGANLRQNFQPSAEARSLPAYLTLSPFPPVRKVAP